MSAYNKYNYHVGLYSLFYFIVCYYFAYQWYLHGFFSVFDVFFDSDPNDHLMAFAHGWGKHALSHPFLEFFSILPRISGIALNHLGLLSDVKVFRDIISLTVSPFFSTVSIFLFFKLANELNIPRKESFLISIVFSLLFSNLLFGVIPESYSISCCLIITLFYYFVFCSNRKIYGDIKLWALLAILLTGITITNINIFFIVYFIHLVRTCEIKWLSAFMRASVFCFANFLFVIILFYLSRWALSIELGDNASPDWIKRFSASSILDVKRNFLNLLSASFYAFYAINADTVLNPHCIEIKCKSLVYVDTAKNSLLWAFSIGLTLMLLFKKTYSETYKHWNNIFLISLMIIFYNMFFHMYFGRGMFLYTQHWILPMFLFLIPILRKRLYILYIALISLLVINLGFLISVKEVLSV